MVLMRPIALDDQFVYMIDYMIFCLLLSNRALTGFFRKSIQEQVVELLVKQVEEFHVEEQILGLLVKYVEENNWLWGCLSNKLRSEEVHLE